GLFRPPDHPDRPVPLYMDAVPPHGRRHQALHLGCRSRVRADRPRSDHLRHPCLFRPRHAAGLGAVRLVLREASIMATHTGNKGTGTFIRQRVTGVINIVLVGFLIWLVVSLAGADRAQMVATFSHPLVWIPALVLIGAAL